MACKDSKLYHSHEFNVVEFYNTYLSKDMDPQLKVELILYVMNTLHRELSSGNVTGKSLVEYVVGPAMFKLLVCCEYFEEIYSLEFNQFCKLELEKWLRNEPGALDWNHMIEHACELEGNSAGLEEKKAQLRERVKRVVACKLSGDNLVTEGPIPPSDCLLCVYGLDVISHSQEAFCANLKKLCSYLKPGHQLMMFGFFNGTFFKVGENEFHLLKYNRSFLENALAGCGLTVQSMDVQGRKHDCKFIGYDEIYYVRALKEVKKK